MNIESTEVVWLTANEAEKAIRDFVRSRGFEVTAHARVDGLGNLSKTKYAVSVQTHKHTHEVIR